MRLRQATPGQVQGPIPSPKTPPDKVGLSAPPGPGTPSTPPGPKPNVRRFVDPLDQIRRVRIIERMLSVLILAGMCGSVYAGNLTLESWYAERARVQEMDAILKAAWNQQVRFRKNSDRFAGDLRALRLLVPRDRQATLNLVATKVKDSMGFLAEICDPEGCRGIDEKGTIRVAMALITPNEKIELSPEVRSAVHLSAAPDSGKKRRHVREVGTVAAPISPPEPAPMPDDEEEDDL